MPSFNTTDRRLSMRYASGAAFSFNHIRINATDQGIMDLANAIAEIQSTKPTRVLSIVTRQMV